MVAPRVPVSSGAETNQMLLTGNAQFACSPASDMRGLVDAGKLRFLAFCSEERDKDYPDVPTFKEVGYPGVVISTWYGLAVSKDVPQEAVTVLRETLAKAMQDQEVQKMLNNIGHTPAYLNAEDFRGFVKKMEKLYQKIAKDASIELK